MVILVHRTCSTFQLPTEARGENSTSPSTRTGFSHNKHVAAKLWLCACLGADLDQDPKVRIASPVSPHIHTNNGALIHIPLDSCWLCTCWVWVYKRLS
jgi:hypothetical protein